MAGFWSLLLGVNGYDSLNLTKLDVLSEIKIAVKYTLNGDELLGLPALGVRRGGIIAWLEGPYNVGNQV
ncbi:Adenylosuccinate synthase [Marasmius sp. AFHP31]|nr:Adenylosuccinate synthase [Marasmius sp. AFHP31]